MKITTKENGALQLEEVYNGLTLKSDSGEELVIMMRDTGFEFSYGGKWYSAKKGELEDLYSSIKVKGEPLSLSVPTTSRYFVLKANLEIVCHLMWNTFMVDLQFNDIKTYNEAVDYGFDAEEWEEKNGMKVFVGKDLRVTKR